MGNKTNQILNKNLLVRLSDSLENWNVLSGEERENLHENITSALELQNYPFFESETKVVLIYYGKAKGVALLSDITGWTEPIPFKKLDDNGLFYLSLQLEPDARIQYQLVVDGIAICDPSNKYKCLHGLGEMSELAMPKYERHPYLEQFLYGKQENYDGLIKHTLPAGALPYEHEVYVCLPPNYNQSVKYPTVYFHDGPDYIRFGLAPYSINRLITEKEIESCIAVFVTPPNLHQPIEPNRSTEYGMNDDYVKFFCNELVPFIDKNFSTLQIPQKRLIIGDSYAGLISLNISFSRTDLFANAYSQSGYFSFNNNKIIKLINERSKKPIKLLIDIGTYEEKVGADFLPSSELNFTNANRRMRDILSSKGYDFIYKEYHEGHTWGNWRRHLIDALKYFLGGEEG